MAGKEFLVEIHQKITTITIKEFSPNGVKIQYNAVGKITGRYSGRHLETIDILRKQDGSNQWDSRIIQTTTDGDVIMIVAKGTGKLVNPSLVKFEGEGKFMTQSKKLGWLNSTECLLEGTNDLETDEAVFKVYASHQAPNSSNKAGR